MVRNSVTEFPLNCSTRDAYEWAALTMKDTEVLITLNEKILLFVRHCRTTDAASAGGVAVWCSCYFCGCLSMHRLFG